MKETTFAENDYFLILVFKENHVFIEEEDNPSEKVIIVEEKLDILIKMSLET